MIEGVRNAQSKIVEVHKAATDEGFTAEQIAAGDKLIEAAQIALVVSTARSLIYLSKPDDDHIADQKLKIYEMIRGLDLEVPEAWLTKLASI